jgi:hypothetical protein
MAVSDIRILIISIIFLFLAEVIWNFFMLTGVLYLFKQRSILYTKHFYYYIIYGAIASALTDRGFSYGIINIPFLNNIWQNTGIVPHLGFIIIPIIFLVVVHYYLANLVLDLDSKTSFKIALIMGILTAPWPAFFSSL